MIKKRGAGAMKGSITRAKQCRQHNLHEIKFDIAGTLLASPVASGQDVQFVQSVTKVSEGRYKVTVKDVAQRNLVPVSLVPQDKYLSRAVASDTSSITVELATLEANIAVAASAVIQDLTYTADTAGFAGNSITISYVDTGTAGAEVVNVVGTDIEVEIEAGVSTATQIKTAVDASVAAAALVNVSISGTAGNAQAVQAVTNLAGGDDARAVGDVKDGSLSIVCLWHGDNHLY